MWNFNYSETFWKMMETILKSPEEEVSLTYGYRIYGLRRMINHLLEKY